MKIEYALLIFGLMLISSITYVQDYDFVAGCYN